MSLEITVFTPTYNRAYIIGEVYVSLEKQTYKNFEWLVIDDGSSDNTEDVIKNFIQENKMEDNILP
nr:glycosyltransferase family A protein [uncultured Acetatifactor sp.]